MKLYTLTLILSALLLLQACKSKEKEGNLSGTAWKVTQIIKGDAKEQAPSAYVLRFENNSNYGIHLDVNSCGGEYEAKRGNKIKFDYAACTEACCDTPFAMEILEILQEADSYEIKNNEMQIFASAKTLQLIKN